MHLAHLLFSESPSRFLIEYDTTHHDALARLYATHVGHGDHFTSAIGGRVVPEPRLLIREGMDSRVWIDLPLSKLKDAWQPPLHVEA